MTNGQLSAMRKIAEAMSRQPKPPSIVYNEERDVYEVEALGADGLTHRASLASELGAIYYIIEIAQVCWVCGHPIVCVEDDRCWECDATFSRVGEEL